MLNAHTDLRDSVVKKPSRFSRSALLAGFVVVTPLITSGVAVLLGEQFFPDNSLVSSISMVVGFFAAVPVVGIALEKNFLIRNVTTGMFVTQDTLRSLLGKGDINVSYAPGTHISFPWERRIAENNIILEDAPIEFTFKVLRPDGTLFGKGSYRMRPDPSNPVSFLSSAAAVGEEVRDLIIAEIQKFFKDGSAVESGAKLGDLNGYLNDVFVNTLAIVEDRNGITISDVTVSELLPSEELQRTMTGISEARSFQEAVLVHLGMKSQSELNRALKRGTISQADVKLARENQLAISGNMDNLKIERREFDINFRGLSDEAVNAITELAKTPAAQAAATAAASRARGGGSKTRK